GQPPGTATCPPTSNTGWTPNARKPMPTLPAPWPRRTGITPSAAISAAGSAGNCNGVDAARPHRPRLATRSIGTFETSRSSGWSSAMPSRSSCLTGNSGWIRSWQKLRRYSVMSDGKPVNLLVLPRLRGQNANAIASPHTWGFPAMSAFMGFMHALERRLPAEQKLLFEQVGVICHDFQPQTASAGYNLQQFNLTRNPVGKDGKTLGIAEEGRMHMEISLDFDVTESDDTSEAAARNLKKSEQEKIRHAAAIDDIVHGMRIAGGSVLPRTHQRHKPQLIALSSNPDDAERTFRRLCRQLLPGFA